MVSNIGFNFLVKRGGKDVISCLRRTRKLTTPINFEGLKYVPNLEKDTVQLSKTVGKHKIPRFIYHMTNKKNYESMIKDGIIRTSRDGLLGKGVFTTELTNFFKCWRKCKSWGDTSLQEKLLGQVAKGSDEIVIIRIPTAKLDPNKLIIRSQNKLFSWAFSGKAEEAFEQITQRVNNEALPNSWLNKVREILKDIITKQESKKYAEHLTTGAPAKMSNLYKQRKEALEYVYLDNIPLTDVQKIGELDIKALRESVEYDPIHPMRSIFTKLLDCTPEVKGAELLNC